MSPLVEMKNVSQHFGKAIVLEEINLHVNEGWLFGLLGPSGSGKTTLVKMMIGLLKPTHGKALLNAEELPSLNVLSKIGYMAQADALYQDLTGYENLSFFASIYGLKKDKKAQRISDVLNMVDLVAHKDKMVEFYSGGMLRRLSLAIALLHEPKLLILDEPTVGIDPVLRKKIWHEFKQLQAKGITIIITTHVMEEAEKCDQLALLREGKLMAVGSPEDITSKSGQMTLEQAFLAYSEVGEGESS